MNPKRLIFSLSIIMLIATMMWSALIKPIAASFIEKEAALNPDGLVHELFRDNQGKLWVSDYTAGEIWKVDPVSNAYTVYEGLVSASDGRLDNSGTLWWSDYDGGKLGRLVPGAAQGTVWPLQSGANPLGIAFDSSGLVWVADVSMPDIYRFNPSSSQLCTYPVPNDGTADYILFENDRIWLGDTTLGRILRLNPNDNTYTIWQLPVDSYPQGMAQDGNGDLWWADEGLKVLGRLNPQSNQITTYAVPVSTTTVALPEAEGLVALERLVRKSNQKLTGVLSTTVEETALPETVAIKNGYVWYTDMSGKVGRLDPALASGSSATISPSTATGTLTCSTITGTPIDVSERKGTMTWTDVNYPIDQNSDGWLIFDLPIGAAPWGLAVGDNIVWFDDQGIPDVRAQTLGWMMEGPALTTNLTGTGSGTVTSDPAGISCGGDCIESYPDDTVVTLTHAAETGSTFTGWGGACTGTGDCVVILDASKSVTATFTLDQHLLTTNTNGTGSGSISSSPAGINCPGDCSEIYDYGTVITLTHAAQTGSTFTGWSGACTGTGDCIVTMDAPNSVTATFTLDQHLLTATTNGTGSGSINSSPAGINCPGDCSELYDYGTIVTLTAASEPDSTFTGWSGAGCSGNGDCVITMTAANSVVATFTKSNYKVYLPFIIR